MATYVIGDVQGCYDELLFLLDRVNYDQQEDRLWFTGDLVNRGPKSLEVLRFVKNLPDTICVLGNHDLSLLALAYTQKPLHDHTLDAILNSPDRGELLRWLRNLPLIYIDNETNCALVHAGIYPAWNLEEASRYAREVETILQGPHFKQLLENMFGNTPSHWNDTMSGWDRYRFVINVFTRMRFCHLDGSLELSYKGTIQEAPPDLLPWFKVKQCKESQAKILFGHWAALQGQVKETNNFALDTGCVWENSLTAMRLEDQKLFSIDCKK